MVTTLTSSASGSDSGVKAPEVSSEDAEALDLLTLNYTGHPVIEMTPASTNTNTNSKVSSSLNSVTSSTSHISPSFHESRAPIAGYALSSRASLLNSGYATSSYPGSARTSHYVEFNSPDSFTDTIARDDMPSLSGSSTLYSDASYISPMAISDADVARVANLVVHMRDSRYGHESTLRKKKLPDEQISTGVSSATERRVLYTKTWFELHAAFISQCQVGPQTTAQTSHSKFDGVYNPLQIIRNRQVRARYNHKLEPAKLSTITVASTALAHDKTRKLVWEVDVNEMFADLGWQERNRSLMVDRNGRLLYRRRAEKETHEQSRKQKTKSTEKEVQPSDRRGIDLIDENEYKMQRRRLHRPRLLADMPLKGRSELEQIRQQNKRQEGKAQEDWIPGDAQDINSATSSSGYVKRQHRSRRPRFLRYRSKSDDSSDDAQEHYDSCSSSDSYSGDSYSEEETPSAGFENLPEFEALNRGDQSSIIPRTDTNDIPQILASSEPDLALGMPPQLAPTVVSNPIQSDFLTVPDSKAMGSSVHSRSRNSSFSSAAADCAESQLPYQQSEYGESEYHHQQGSHVSFTPAPSVELRLTPVDFETSNHSQAQRPPPGLSQQHHLEKLVSELRYLEAKFLMNGHRANIICNKYNQRLKRLTTAKEGLTGQNFKTMPIPLLSKSVIDLTNEFNTTTLVTSRTLLTTLSMRTDALASSLSSKYGSRFDFAISTAEQLTAEVNTTLNLQARRLGESLELLEKQGTLFQRKVRMKSLLERTGYAMLEKVVTLLLWAVWCVFFGLRLVRLMFRSVMVLVKWLIWC
ncbi:hypothetical protein V1512DRAFT_266288 [Lipomyces arxii]|uniref:uncharacterized protein n=1 Tax=Lipomyces arxii TaxID=56418 RepID=UPI0034CE5043